MVPTHCSAIDFMKWLNSLDELLYEVMSWLIFFPLTLWCAAVRPFWTMAQIELEAELPEDQQYAAVLSPPLFLALALLVGHGVSTALGETDAIIANRHGLAGLINDNASALVVRIIIFAGFPLFLAARLVRSRGAVLDRLALRRPFYEQCYPAAVFALGVTLGTSLAHVANPAIYRGGQLLVLASIAYFVVVETLWFSRQRGTGYLRTFGNVLWGLMQGLALMVLVAVLLMG